MAPRASWKGFLKVGELNCAVGLYTATSTSDRISFHLVNRQTGHRLNREFIDSVTQEPVGRDDQVKGYEIGKNNYIALEPEEISAVIPHGDKTLVIDAFIATHEIDDVYFDKPYYLAPADKASNEVFALIRDGLQAEKSVAIAKAVLFRRARTLLIRAFEKGLIATTLHYDYEIRAAQEAFKDLADIKLEDEMLDLATHIIETKMGTFDPVLFEDRYEDALAELVKAKLEGRKIPKPPKREKAEVVNLMEALRQSAHLVEDKTLAKVRSSPRKQKAG